MADWITSIIVNWGALGVAFLMFVENIFPPIPSEVVLPLAGAQAAQGNISLAMAVLGATVGAVLGTLPFYLLGRWAGIESIRRLSARYGRLLTLTPKDVDHADAWFDRNGQYAVVFGRLVPGVRTLISIPAGLTGMTLRRFLIFTTIGTLAWNTILAGAGYGLGQDPEIVETVLSPVSNVVIGGAVVLYAWRVATFGRHR